MSFAFLSLFLLGILSHVACNADICDLCVCDFLDEKHTSPYSIVCNCQDKNSQIHFRTKSPRMLNVTGVIITGCDHVVFHDYAFASTGAFNLHIMNVKNLELKANSMLGANMQAITITNVANLILEPGSVRQGNYERVTITSVNIPNMANIASGEAIKIRDSLTLRNVTINNMVSANIKATLEGTNTTLDLQNVTINKIVSSAVNLGADSIDLTACSLGSSTQGFVLQGKKQVTITDSFMVRETPTDYINVHAPFINMSGNIISLPLVFLGDTVKPSGKFAKMLIHNNKIRDITYVVV